MDFKKTPKPCGMCDVGIYHEVSMLNESAIKFMSINENERLGHVPNCKTQNRKCVGYLDLHEMKKRVDDICIANRSLGNE